MSLTTIFPIKLKKKAIINLYFIFFGIVLSLVTKMVKNLLAMQETPGLIPGLGRSPGEGNTTHSSTLAWRIL